MELIMRAISVFLYVATVILGSAAILRAVYLYLHGGIIKNSRRSICFTELWRIKLVDKDCCRHGYCFRYWSKPEGGFVLEVNDPGGDLRQTIEISEGELFEWKSLPEKLRGYFTFDGTYLIKYEQKPLVEKRLK